MFSISSLSASLPFVRGAIGLLLISLTVMQSLNGVLHVSLNKLLNKTASFQKEAMRTQVALWFFYEVKFE